MSHRKRLQKIIASAKDVRFGETVAAKASGTRVPKPRYRPAIY